MKDQLIDLLRERANELAYEERTDGKLVTSALLFEAADQIESLQSSAAAHGISTEMNRERTHISEPQPWLSPWISVEESPNPPNYEEEWGSDDVLVLTSEGDRIIAHRAYIDGLWHTLGNCKLHGTVTHWMPLPEPPK